MESLKQPCEVIQALLIQKNFDEISPGQKDAIENHISTCSDCQNFQSVLLKMNDLSVFRPENTLVPPEIVHQKLRQRVAAKRKEKTSLFQQSLVLLKNILDYRIPVYQVVAAGAVILLIFFISRQDSFDNQFKITDSRSVTIVESPVVETMGIVSPSDVLDRQIIGQSVREDTALFRFVVTAM